MAQHDTGTDDGSHGGRHESPIERLDRHWLEILQELRVTQTGIQILTGFLLTVPFQSRFTDLTGSQRAIYLVLVLLAAITTGLVVAPVSLHRLLYRRHVRATLVAAADRLMRAGLVCLALVVSGVVLLVVDVVTGRTPAIVTASALLVILGLGWFALPAWLGRRAQPDPEDPEGSARSAPENTGAGRPSR
ncbi:DUF6328 family protein [Actinotalea sp. C106]|uniref:DUF6328 family protein n=1 Tax=Actinotalea sp. C106 TaxID=2908644 RepID=UPI0020278736|nr:DUF6328 family protein [Actinotalea sp. C106]